MEEKALKLTGQLWNLLVIMENAEPGHQSDLQEHQRDIHNIQNRIAARPYFRKNKV